MFLDYLENILQLSSILIALLISLFRYIGTRKRGWLFAVGFSVGNLLSSYFWTAYLIIMGDTPNVSDNLAYFGWNMGFFFLLLLIFQVKSREERRYFHVLMLIPIPLNIWQLTMYLQFGGVANSVYQVIITTATACLALQSLLYSLKKKQGEKGAVFYTAFAVLISLLAEYGMWTSTCFDGEISNLYYPFSFLSSLSYLMLVWAMDRSETELKKKEETRDAQRFQTIMKLVYAVVVISSSVGGIALGIWIRDVLGNNSGVLDDSVYEIIPMLLFLISVVMAVAAAAVILIIFFQHKMLENRNFREEWKEAEEQSSAKSEFLAQLSHEIRTPLNAVLGMNELVMVESLKSRDALPKEPDEIRDRFQELSRYSIYIDNAGRNLLSIVNGAMDFSGIEAGKLELREQEYELCDLITNVRNVILFRAQLKDLELEMKVEEDLPAKLCGDEVRIGQILTNVLDNAVKYTRKGRVECVVKAEGAKPRQKGDTLELQILVRDTGIGIRKEDQSRLFERYERMDPDRNQGIEGTGLGLAITKKLVEWMQGSIDVSSEYGKGSEFLIRLPQRIGSADPVGNIEWRMEEKLKEKTASGQDLIAPDARILIADDDRMDQIVASSLLKDTKIRVDLCGSGEEALERIRENDYDLVFLDQKMPELDGTETLYRLRIREQNSGKHLPVICLTADAAEGAKERYCSRGFTDYLAKPVDGKALKELLRRYLPREKVVAVRLNDTVFSGNLW